MRVEVSMTKEPEFYVSSWWAKSPEFMIAALRSQLEAAQAVWPELHRWSFKESGKQQIHGRSKGGTSRAESLSPERRSEIAAAAANTRWAKAGG